MRVRWFGLLRRESRLLEKDMSVLLRLVLALKS